MSYQIVQNGQRSLTQPFCDLDAALAVRVVRTLKQSHHGRYVVHRPGPSSLLGSQNPANSNKKVLDHIFKALVPIVRLVGIILSMIPSSGSNAVSTLTRG